MMECNGQKEINQLPAASAPFGGVVGPASQLSVNPMVKLAAVCTSAE